ncbi:hypothetical protein [Eisenibacter elegans]|jgi:hypothetical protein|uniref:hypothetical protein n=1 Tax=Eisenibacter elegans TaxID=997 RepID=UPI000424DA01|nr:hypothetical protein [Eisenibacter elegans]
MKTIRTLLLLVGLLALFPLATQAQSKNIAVGLRLGEPTGINVKKYLSNGNALDFVLGGNGYGYHRGRRYWRDEYEYRPGLVLMVNYLWQNQISGVDGLEWYAGVGGQVGSRRYWNRRERREYQTGNLGLTGMIGIEYFIPSTPISLGLDLGPYIELTPAPAWVWFDGGFSIRVNF